MRSFPVRSVPLPAKSALHARRAPGDFLDCYAAMGSPSPRSAAQAVVAFPGWAGLLLKLRGAVACAFGLRQQGPETGDKIGPFPVESETEDEIIAGFDDKHLNFRVAVLRDAGHIMLATWVRPHNLGGRLYLALIMPFHIAIARNAIARAACVT